MIQFIMHGHAPIIIIVILIFNVVHRDPSE